MSQIDETVPTKFVVDASVAVKWFGIAERFIPQAHALLDSHLRGSVQIHLSELVPYEVGSALMRSREEGLPWPTGLFWTSDFVWVTLDPQTAEATRDLVLAYGLSYYDASYLALALREHALLVSDDQLLLDAAESEGVGVPLEQIPVIEGH